MKRSLIFDIVNGKYSIIENEDVIFSIDPTTMKFDSKNFYEGLYKDKSCAIALSCGQNTDKTGRYIFEWIESIINYISENIIEPETDNVEPANSNKRIIKLFDLPACAGNGNYIDDESGDDFETENPNADYAVKISGESMEPTIKDQSIVLVKKFDGSCFDNRIYIFVIDGDVMCKRYKLLKRGSNFVPDNADKKFKKITNTRIKDCTILGEVIDY